MDASYAIFNLPVHYKFRHFYPQDAEVEAWRSGYNFFKIYIKYYLDLDRDFLGERERDLLLDFECPRDLERLRLLLPDIKWT
jgi:hypothetical protein